MIHKNIKFYLFMEYVIFPKVYSFFYFEYMCLQCVCVHIHDHLHKCRHIHGTLVQWSRDSLQYLFSPFFSFEAESNHFCVSRVSYSLNIQGFSCFHFPLHHQSPEVTDICSTAYGFHMSSGDPTSCPYAFVARLCPLCRIPRPL